MPQDRRDGKMDHEKLRSLTKNTLAPMTWSGHGSLVLTCQSDPSANLKLQGWPSLRADPMELAVAQVDHSPPALWYPEPDSEDYALCHQEADDTHAARGNVDTSSDAVDDISEFKE